MKRLFIVLLLVFLLCFTFSCQQGEETAEEGITEEEAKVMYDRYLEARHTINLDMLDEIYAEDIVVHDPNYPEDIIGLANLKEYYSNNHKALPDLHFTIDEIIVKGNKIFCVWTFTGTNSGPLKTPLGEIPATGKKVQFSGAAIDLLDEGKIVEEWLYFNVLQIMQQLGFTINPPQSPEVQEEKN